ncbi:outer membrane protein assembly factor BamC [Colwellia sp. RSH04]|uniref:outer membrane protein assembly factor BamC n=1 Tax=Colwellia sp. RSH04 TaxID=2305464 RepID=UPI000E592B82|nr:outer membrane protein assembly factor BamC [Colwellia sp. RSH04]RHW77311.1 outer membrane protein assembly factor BamC [Colwellia sp. RSH04]
MNRQVFFLSLLTLSITACSSMNSKQAMGDFDYAEKPEAKPLVIPEGLDKPAEQKEFYVTNKVNHDGPVGKNMDIRAPSLVLPIAASSRVVEESSISTIWFDKVLEDRELLAFIEKVVLEKLDQDAIGYTKVEEDIEITLSKVLEGATSLKETSIAREGVKTSIIESDWYHDEVESGWLFTEIESATSLRFRYQLVAKPHGRSVSLTVSMVDYMRTDKRGGNKTMDPIDKQRAEKAMLNSIISLVDYNYRVQQRENRLMRSNQKLVSFGKNPEDEHAYVVEMESDKLWENMPVFFEKHGFTISDLNEEKRIYFVDFVKPESSVWDAIWGDDVPVIDVNDAHYQFVLAPLDEKGEQTSVTIYNADGEPLTLETLERIFPVMEAGLSFRNVF